ncbi:MAG: hypothetical protein WCQ86_06915 [Bacteroidaceae bacterium]
MENFSYFCILFVAIMLAMSACTTPKKAKVGLAILKGRWLVVAASGEAIITSVEGIPYIEFDLRNRRVYGNAGINAFTADFLHVNGKKESLQISKIESTSPSDEHCSLNIDLHLEYSSHAAMQEQILSALSGVQEFAQQQNGTIVLLDRFGDQSLILKRA